MRHLGFAATFALGCGPAQDCPSIGCMEFPPGVEFPAAQESSHHDLADGLWVITLTVDDVARTCSGTAPFWQDLVCDPGLGTTGSTYGVEDPGSSNSWENLGGPSVDGLELDSVPDSMTFLLRAEHDGVTVVDDAFEARMTEDFYPAGRECSTVCRGTWRGEVAW